jgi:hypothetical protein
MLSVCGCLGRSNIDYFSTQAAVDANCGAATGSCRTRTCAPPLAEGTHVEVCSKIAFASNPPTSGPHYGVWAAFDGEYTKPVPRGFYLHSMEHSGVMLLYNCALFKQAGGCDAMLKQIRELIAASPTDPLCSPPVKNRLLIIPDPDLDVPFAAAAWGFSLKAECFDESQVRDFITAHYGKNYENICGGGIDPTDGSQPANCGR